MGAIAIWVGTLAPENESAASVVWYASGFYEGRDVMSAFFEDRIERRCWGVFVDGLSDLE